MIRYFIINNYISREFLRVVLVMTFVFFCLGFILNIFEEINFFKDFEVGMGLPVLMSMLLVPSLMYNMFPFIILLSGIWFFLKIKKTDEIIAMKSSGMSNFSVIIVPSFLVVILGIFLVSGFSPISSFLVKKYESIKGAYERDQDYLAAVTVNGIWIKEKNYGKNFIIKASNISGENLENLTIYEFDNNQDFEKRIEAKIANISSLEWQIKNAKLFDREGKVIEDNIKNLTYRSMYDIKKIRSLYSNLDTISFWNLNNEIKLLEKRGYSTNEMKAKMQQSFAFPFFLLSMVFLAGVFTLGMTFKENNWTYVFISIITSVLIFYFNRFSEALGKTDRLPIEVSVWMPVLIIFIFSAVGLIHANQK